MTEQQTTDAKEKPAVKASPSKQEKPAKQRSRWPVFILAFVVGSATSFFALNYYPLLMPAAPKPIATEPVVEAEPVNIAPDISTQKPASPMPISTAISSEEGAALLDSMQELQQHIQGLSSELQTLRQQQAAAAHSQALLENMQLHSRLIWIMDSNSHLPQIKLAWQEISLLPSLTEAQRAEAEAMLQLAEKRLSDVHRWQQTLSLLAAQLNPDEYDDVIASAASAYEQNPWLQWLTQQFSLRRSANSQETALLELKRRLSQIERDMALEQWPTAVAWAQLRAQLQLHILQKTDAPQVLQLPENFDAIQQDVEQLRQTARTWLKEA